MLIVRSAARRWALPLERVLRAGAVDRLTRLPHAPKVWCGATSHRGRVVPVLDLARLHGTEEPNAGLVVLVFLDGQIVGLRVAEIDGIRPSEESGPEIWDLDKIALPPLAARHAASDASADERTATASEPLERGLAVKIGGQRYWLPSAQVAEVLEATAPIEVPWADPRVPAILIHGSSVLPVVRVDLLLGLEAAPGGPLIVACAGTRRIILQVDETSGITTSSTTPVLPLVALLESLPGNSQETVKPRGESVRTLDEAWLAFVLEHQTCLLPLRLVLSVAAGSHRAAIPAGAPRALIGVSAIGGRILPVVDQRQALGLSTNEPSAVDIVVAPPDAPHFILAAQQIDGIVRLRADLVRATGGRTMIDGVAHLGDRLVWLLAPAALAPTAEVAG
jgi:chemotaxis signal transduction protein